MHYITFALFCVTWACLFIFNNRKPKSYEMNKPQAEECAVPLHLLPISLNAGKEKVSVNI